MDASEQSRFDELYPRHLRALKLQGKAPVTVDGYARAWRRITAYFDRGPDQSSGVRPYGLLHGKAQRRFARVQLLLRVVIPVARPAIRCACCRRAG